MPKSALSSAAPAADHSQAGDAGHPPVKVEDRGYFISYRGTGDALIAAGVVRADQLPGAPGIGSTCATFYKGQPAPRGKGAPHDEHYLQVRKIGRIFEAFRGVPEEIRERRLEEVRAARKRKEEEAARQRKEEEDAKDVAFHRDPENLRYQVEMYVRVLTKLVEQHSPGAVQADRSGRSGQFFCRFRPEGLDDTVDALEHLLSWALAVKIVAVDPHAPKLEAARRDATFQGFLQSQCLKD